MDGHKILKKIAKWRVLDPETSQAFGRVSLIGTHLVACTVVGLAMGYYLDEWLGTEPWLLLLFLFFGIAAGFKNVYTEARRMQQEQHSDVYDGPVESEDTGREPEAGDSRK